MNYSNKIIEIPVNLYFISCWFFGRYFLNSFKNFIFVCGTHHSGTSLVARILASHPEACSPSDETRIFLGSRFMATLGLGKLLHMARVEVARYVIEKTPKHIRQLHRINKYAPGSRIVIVVRDPIDVIASVKKRTEISIPDEVARWNMASKIASDREILDNHVVVRYEDIVEKFAMTVEFICSEINITFDKDMLNYHKKSVNWFNPTSSDCGDGVTDEGHVNLRNWQVNQPVYDGRAQYRHLLSHDEMSEIVELIDKDLVIKFGYEKSVNSFSDRI